MDSPRRNSYARLECMERIVLVIAALLALTGCQPHYAAQPPMWLSRTPGGHINYVEAERQRESDFTNCLNRASDPRPDHTINFDAMQRCVDASRARERAIGDSTLDFPGY